jgi:hypothetical protein
MTREQFLQELQSRVDTQLELARDFGPSYALTRATERAKARKLFSQAAVATTNAPLLQNDATVMPPQEAIEAARNLPRAEKIPISAEPEASKLASVEEIIEQRCAGSIAPRVDAFLEKNASLFMTDAQRRYPELLKAAGSMTRPVPTTKRAKSAMPVRSGLSGGAA